MVLVNKDNNTVIWKIIVANLNTSLEAEILLIISRCRGNQICVCFASIFLSYMGLSAICILEVRCKKIVGMLYWRKILFLNEIFLF